MSPARSLSAILSVLVLFVVCVFSVENVVGSDWEFESESSGNLVGGGQVRPVQEVLVLNPLLNPNTISDSTYAVLGHPKFPKYNVRIKKSHFCDGTVR